MNQMQKSVETPLTNTDITVTEAILTKAVATGEINRCVYCLDQRCCFVHYVKTDVRTIGYLQHNMAGTSNDKILLT